MKISIGVVADVRRGDMGELLAVQVGADFLNYDTEMRGGTWNHSMVWRLHAPTGNDWVLNLEDDALPVDGFREQLTAALAVAPAPIVSLYLGRGYISDPRVEGLLTRADLLNVNWMVTQGTIYHAVALAVRGDLLASLVDNLPRSDHPIDSSLSMWARRERHRVAYTWPCLVDHSDGESLVTRYRRRERRAWRTGVRDAWCDKMMCMV